MECLVELGLANYYGEVKLYKINDKYYLGLENYDGDFGIEISEKLSVAIIEEFKDKKEMIYLEDLIG